jgi:hypothetical protein
MMNNAWPLHRISIPRVCAAVIPLLLAGCGLTLNSTSVASGGPGTTTSPGNTTDTNGGQTVPIPSALQPLTGCANPNSGTSSGDWGAGSNPVYVNAWDVVVGDPIYRSNTIFWVSRENEPGESVLLTGAFTDAAKNARIAAIPPGTTDWQSLVRESNTLVPITEQTTTSISFIIPSSFPSGVYGFQIEDPTAPAVLSMANVPSLSWAIGVPSRTDASMALMHAVYDCGAEQGGVLRIFGKNFLPSHQVILQSSSGMAYALAPSKLDANSISVAVPANMTPGNYNLWVGTVPWTPTSAPAAQITIYAPLSRHVQTVSCPSLVGDGVTDNSKRLQQCLDRYAPPPGSNYVTYLEISAGSFALAEGITGRSFEVLIGSSSGGTRFVGQLTSSPPTTWLTVPQYFGMANISFEAPVIQNLLFSSGSVLGDPQTSGHLFFDNVTFASTAGEYNPGEVMFGIAGPDIQVYNSSFLSNSNQDFDIYFGDGAIVSGSQFILNNWTGMAIEDSQNVIFENNLTYSQNQLGQGPGGVSGGSGLSITRSNGAWGPSALSRDVYVGYNTFQNVGSQSQQIILNDGDGGAYFGPIATSTAETVTLANDPWWAWMGTTNPGAASIAIISGTGVGQYSFLKAYSGRTISLATPWKTLPDETSVVVISQYELNMTWAHNTMTNTQGFSFVLSDALEGVIEDNTLINSGAGILISAFGPYGGPASYGPVINTDILRNTLSVGMGTDIWQSANTNFAGIGVQDFPGCLVSGLMIRDNVVPALNTIFSTNGVNGINGTVIERNHANTAVWLLVPGFLIQNNLPPES